MIIKLLMNYLNNNLLKLLEETNNIHYSGFSTLNIIQLFKDIL